MNRLLELAEAGIAELVRAQLAALAQALPARAY
jgi:hypothetical protein